MEGEARKYQLTWELLSGDSATARPSLGATTPLMVYRLMQFSLRDVIELHYGAEAADRIFREAGVLAGKFFYEKFLAGAKDFNELAKRIQEVCRELSIGIVRFEKVDLEKGFFQLTVDEDLDCSGLPDTSEQICIYDEGFIKGILDSFTGGKFTVREVDCWCSGERTCRFRAEPAIA